MKKFGIKGNILILIVVVLCLAITIFFMWENTQEKTKDTLTIDDSNQSQIDNVSGERFLGILKHSDYTIDISVQEKVLNAQSNAEKVNAICDGTEQWKNKMTEYLALLLGDECTVSSVTIAQENWEVYVQDAIENTTQILQDIYGSGTALPSALVKFEYELYRARAIELYYLCLYTAGLSPNGLNE